MRASELRIGNLVMVKGKITVMYSISNHNARDYSVIKPIPLSEEWLINFGFENIDTNVNGGDNYWGLSRPDFILNRSFQSFQMNTGVDLEHVHQLQNLYFALTGEELTIK